MKNTIPPIKAEIDYLDKNEREIYCVGDWVQTRIEGELTPVRFVSIRHDGATVSNSPYYVGTILSAEKILSNLYSLLNTGKDLFSTRPALCVQYAALLIEVDNAIVRLNIDKNILKSAIIKKWPVDYSSWADKIKEAGKNWGYKDYKETDDVCYFNPGFEYKQFLEEHETYWQALQEKISALVNILKEMGSVVDGKVVNKIQPLNRGGSQSKDNNDDTVVYVSYSWTMMEEVDNMCNAFDGVKLSYKRDVKDCTYRQNIRQFEDEIGRGARVLALINDDYLKSINCMYELSRVFQCGDVEKRLYPVVSITGQRGSEMLKELYGYWERIYQEKKTMLDDLPSGISMQVIDELGYCGLIIGELSNIVSYLTQTNTLSFKDLSSNDYEMLISELRK